MRCRTRDGRRDGKEIYHKLRRKVQEKFIKQESRTSAANDTDMGVLGTVVVLVEYQIQRKHLVLC